MRSGKSFPTLFASSPGQELHHPPLKLSHFMQYLSLFFFMIGETLDEQVCRACDSYYRPTLQRFTLVVVSITMGSREGLWELHTEDMAAAAYSAALV